MTEDEARSWLDATFGARAVDAMTRFAAMIHAESERQNLIAPSTIDHIWSRHIADSAQLIALAPEEGRWLDIGTGAGFPGLVVAMLRLQPTILVEPRRLRAKFLDVAAAELGVANVTVRCARVEQLEEQCVVISARAVGSLENLLRSAAPCATDATRWLLPRGRVMSDDMAAIRRDWRGVFHMKQSLTDPASAILIADHVARR